MKKYLFLLVCISFLNIAPIHDSAKEEIIDSGFVIQESARIQELNVYWNNLSKTVSDGDFEGYADGYHKDAVIVFASGKNKTSVPIKKALAGWKQGFEDTGKGKNISSVEFRFSQRIGDATTAHETGIFLYSTSDADGKNKKDYPTHFEMLLVKKHGKWLGVMEYQRSNATIKEWRALKK
jgi:ketosteroid isomerase-like protein